MELPDTHLEAVRTIAGGHPDADQIAPDILDDLRRWGMVMPDSLEVTGKGATYAGKGERACCEIGNGPWPNPTSLG
jgi:hypothetical protein